MWFSGYCSPRYVWEQNGGLWWKVPNKTFIYVSDAINHLFIISIPSIKLMNVLNRNMIALPNCKLHSFIVWFKDICLDLMFALILPGSYEITCRPGRYRGCQQSAEPTTNPPWRMGCNPTDQDHQTDPQHEEKVPCYHRGIWGINTVLISMWAW